MAGVGDVRHGDRLLAIASNNGAPRHPDWSFTLLATPTATVELGSEMFDVRVWTAGPEEREELGRLIPYFESQQKLTEREIPIVVLERIEAYARFVFADSKASWASGSHRASDPR